MKEPKQYKLNIDAPRAKEPKKIRMSSINSYEYESADSEPRSIYDIYSCDNDSVYVPIDLDKKLKNKA